MVRSTTFTNCAMNSRQKDIAFIQHLTPRSCFMHLRLGVQNAYVTSAVCLHLRFGARRSAVYFYFEIRWGSSRSTIGKRSAEELRLHPNLKLFSYYPDSNRRSIVARSDSFWNLGTPSRMNV